MEDITNVASKSQVCFNCNREIPCTNFTVHHAHCMRNIKLCSKCKEPVLVSELAEHQKLHALTPCAQCGEDVCGTDLEDHIRDSCAKTTVTCRFCDLQMPRYDLNSHQDYCGTRTEKCDECEQYVMMKYLQIHLDSNHTFFKLTDEPGPIESWNRAPDLNFQNAPKTTSQGGKSDTEGTVKRNQIGIVRPQVVDVKPSTSAASCSLQDSSKKEEKDQLPGPAKILGVKKPSPKKYPAPQPPPNSKKTHFEKATCTSGSQNNNTKTQNINDRGDDLQRKPQPNSSTDESNKFNRKVDDRIVSLRNELKQLRRGLNDVTAPYNENMRRTNTHQFEVPLPCAFCDRLIHPDDVRSHQRLCTPDLCVLQVEPAEEQGPCEFCALAFPISQLMTHQESCQTLY